MYPVNWPMWKGHEPYKYIMIYSPLWSHQYNFLWISTVTLCSYISQAYWLAVNQILIPSKALRIFRITLSPLTLMHTQNLGTRTLSLIYRWLEYKADHSPPSSAEGKIIWSFITTCLICLMTWWLGSQISTFLLNTVFWGDQPFLFRAELNFSGESTYGGREYLWSVGFCSKLVWLVAWEDLIIVKASSLIYPFPYLPDPSVFRWLIIYVQD
jgi:hypothetical protein